MDTRGSVFQEFEIEVSKIIFSGSSYLYSDLWYIDLLERIKCLGGNKADFIKIENKIISNYYSRKKALIVVISKPRKTVDA